MAVAALLLSLAGATAVTAAERPLACERLAQLGLGAAVSITSATVVDPRVDGQLEWARGDVRKSLAGARPFCRVVAMARPSSQSRIGIEVWLPLTGWNGRFLGAGNGGYPLSIDYRGLAEGLSEDFAVADTDLGLAAHADELTSGPHPIQWDGLADPTALFVGHPIRMVDFGSRATHEMTVVGKALTAAFYGARPKWSYFAGCSTGGMQAFREAQQYPKDFDGIVAGDPGQNRARVHLSILWDYATFWRQPDRIITKPQLEVIHQSVLAYCGGGPQRPYLTTPLQCDWRPESLLCGPQSSGPCLTPAQVEAADRLYAGPRNPRTGEAYAPGLPRGSELGWAAYMDQGLKAIPFRGVFAFGLGDDVRLEAFDWDRDAETFIATAGPYFDAVATDMSAFARRGGKLLAYHGGSDPLASVADTVDYYEKVVAAGAAPRGAVTDYFRLFVLPGMNHCGGGLGPDRFDRLAAIRDWVEKGRVPDQLAVWKGEADRPEMRASICAYRPTSAGAAHSMARCTPDDAPAQAR